MVVFAAVRQGNDGSAEGGQDPGWHGEGRLT
jgi:hypothetical protein